MAKKRKSQPKKELSIFNNSTTASGKFTSNVTLDPRYFDHNTGMNRLIPLPNNPSTATI